MYKPEVIAVGWEIESPTLAKADELLTALAINKKMGFPVPASYKELLSAVEPFL